MKDPRSRYFLFNACTLEICIEAGLLWFSGVLVFVVVYGSTADANLVNSVASNLVSPPQTDYKFIVDSSLQLNTVQNVTIASVCSDIPCQSAFKCWILEKKLDLLLKLFIIFTNFIHVLTL